MASEGWPSQWAEHAQQHSPIARHAPVAVARSAETVAGNAGAPDSSATPSFAMHTASSRQKKDAVATSARTPPRHTAARKGAGKSTGKRNGVGTSPGSKLLERAYASQASTRRVSRTFDMSPASSSSPTTLTSPAAVATRRARRAAAAAAAFRGGSGRGCGSASASATIAVGSHVIVPIFRYHSHVATPCNGTVRFAGPTTFSGGEDVLGVELDEGGMFGNQGLHNGRRHPGEQRYFVCPDGRGVFVSAHSVRVPAGGAQNWNHSKRAHPNLLCPEPPHAPSAPDLKPLGVSSVAVRWRVNGDPAAVARFEIQYRIATESATAAAAAAGAAAAATDTAGTSRPQRSGNTSGTDAPPTSTSTSTSTPLLDDTEQWVHHHAPDQADSTWDWQTAVVKIEQSSKSSRRQHSHTLQRLKPDTAYDVRVRALGRVSDWGDFSAMNTCYTAGGTGPAPPVIVRARCNAPAPSAPPTLLCEWEWDECGDEDTLEAVQLQWRRRCSASQVEEEARTDEAAQAEEARAFRVMGIASSKQENEQQTRSRALSGAAPEAIDPTGDSTWRDACRDLDVTTTRFTITSSYGDGSAPGAVHLRPGATYEIRLRGKTAAGWGRWSSSAACTLARRCVPPSSTSSAQSTPVSTDAGDEREQALKRGVLEQQTRLQLWQAREVMLTARGLLRCFRPSGAAASPATSPVAGESALSSRRTPTPTASFTLSRVKLRTAPGTRFFSLILGAQRADNDEADKDEVARAHDANSPASTTKLQIIPFRAASADEATRWVDAIFEAQKASRRRQVGTNQNRATKAKQRSQKTPRGKVEKPMSPELLKAVQGRPSRQTRDARHDMRRATKAVISTVRLGTRATKQAVMRGEHCKKSVQLRGGALFSGTMEKQAKNGQWQQRYFEVKGNLLKYYADESSAALLASIDLSMTTVQYVQGNLFQMHFSRDKPILLRTASQKSAMQWVKRLHGVQKTLKGGKGGTAANDDDNNDDGGSSDHSEKDVDDRRSSPVASALDASFASETSTEIGDHRPSLMVQGNAIFSGALLRKSKYGAWQSRYFEVAGHYFKYFAREQSSTLLASHDLLLTAVKYSGGSDFTLVSAGDKPVVLRADSDVAAEMWVTRLRGIQTALGVNPDAMDDTEASSSASTDDISAAMSASTGVDASSKVTVATADSNHQSVPTSKSPSARRELQKYATSRSHDIRHIDPNALVGQRIRVFDEQSGMGTGSSAGARSGTVLGTRSKFGDSTRHEIMFDGEIEPEVVLLQKKANGKGLKFHVLTDSPRNVWPFDDTQDQPTDPDEGGLASSPLPKDGEDGGAGRSNAVPVDPKEDERRQPQNLTFSTGDSGSGDQQDGAGITDDQVGEQISNSCDAPTEASATLAKVRARAAQRAAQKQKLEAASCDESPVPVALPEAATVVTGKTLPVDNSAIEATSPVAAPSAESDAQLLPNEYEVRLESRVIGVELKGESPAHVAWLQPSDTGGAAARAGVHEGDELLTVMGVDVSNCSHDKCADMIKNTSERPLVLKLARKRHRLSSIEGSVADMDNITSAAEDDGFSDTGSVVLVPIEYSDDEGTPDVPSQDGAHRDADSVAKNRNKDELGSLPSKEFTSLSPAPEKRVSGIGKLFGFNASSSGQQSPTKEITFSSRENDTGTPNSPTSPKSPVPPAPPSPESVVPLAPPSPEEGTTVLQCLCSSDGVELLHFASPSEFPHNVWLRIAAVGDEATNLTTEAIVLESVPQASPDARSRRSESASSVTAARPSLLQQPSVGDLAAVEESEGETRPKAKSLSEWEKERAAVLQTNEQVRASVGEDNAEDVVLSHWEVQRALKLKANAGQLEQKKPTRTLLLMLPLHELHAAVPGATTTAFRVALQQHGAPEDKCFSLLRENGQVACNLVALHGDNVADLTAALNSRIQEVLPRSPRASPESSSPPDANNSLQAIFSIFNAVTSGNVDLLREWLEKKQTTGLPTLDVNLRAPEVIGGLKVGVDRTLRSASTTEYDQVSTDSGDCLLSMATFAGQDEVVKLLLRHGARWDVRNDAGMSAADVAMDHNQHYLEFPVGPVDSDSSDEEAGGESENKAALQRKQSVKGVRAQRRQSNHFMRQTCQQERDIERDRAAFAKALKVGVTMKKHPSKGGKAHDRKITLSRHGDKLHVHKTGDGPGKKGLELKDIQSIVEGVDQFAKVVKLQAKREANGQFDAGTEELADQLNLQPAVCFTIVGPDGDRNFDFEAKSVEQQSVMVDGLRLLIAGRLDWNAAVATATPPLSMKTAAAKRDSEAQHIHAFCALEHYWNTHMHLVEEAFHDVNARHSEQVTFDEFKKMLRVLGLPLSDSEVGTVFKAIDADGNGMLDINEIHTGCRAMRRKLLGLADHEELPPANPLPPRPPPRT